MKVCRLLTVGLFLFDAGCLKTLDVCPTPSPGQPLPAGPTLWELNKPFEGRIEPGCSRTLRYDLPEPGTLVVTFRPENPTARVGVYDGLRPLSSLKNQPGEKLTITGLKPRSYYVVVEEPPDGLACRYTLLTSLERQ